MKEQNRGYPLKRKEHTKKSIYEGEERVPQRILGFRDKNEQMFGGNHRKKTIQ